VAAPAPDYEGSEADDNSLLADALVQQSILVDLLDSGPALVFVADAEMRYLAVNATACRTLGYSRDELLALRVTDVAVAEDAGALYTEMVADGVQQGETLVRTKDGILLPFRYTARETAIAGLRYWIAVGFIPGSSPAAVCRDDTG
jgi:PAS domain S-box-containing protein